MEVWMAEPLFEKPWGRECVPVCVHGMCVSLCRCLCFCMGVCLCSSIHAPVCVHRVSLCVRARVCDGTCTRGVCLCVYTSVLSPKGKTNKPS